MCSGVRINRRRKRKPPLTRWCLNNAEREHHRFALQNERYGLPFIGERYSDLLKVKRSRSAARRNEFRPESSGGYPVPAFAGWGNPDFDCRRNWRSPIVRLLDYAPCRAVSLSGCVHVSQESLIQLAHEVTRCLTNALDVSAVDSEGGCCGQNADDSGDDWTEHHLPSLGVIRYRTLNLSSERLRAKGLRGVLHISDHETSRQ